MNAELAVLNGEYLAAMHYCFAWVMGTRIEVWSPNVDVEPRNSFRHRI